MCSFILKKYLGKPKKYATLKLIAKLLFRQEKSILCLKRESKKGSIKNYFDKIFGFSTFQSAWKKKLAKKLRRNGNYSHFNIEWR